MYHIEQCMRHRHSNAGRGSLKGLKATRMFIALLLGSIIGQSLNALLQSETKSELQQLMGPV